MDQDVLFRIGLADHPETGPKLRQLASDVRGTMADINESIVSVGRTAEATRRALSTPPRIAFDAPITVPTASGHAAGSTTTVTSNYEQQLSRLANTTPESLTQPHPRFSGTTPVAPPTAVPEPIVPQPVVPQPVVPQPVVPQPVVPQPVVPQPVAPEPITTPPVAPQPAPSAPDRYEAPKKGHEDAKQYADSFGDTLAQMTGMSGADLTMLVGGDDERFQQLGKERGEAYRKGLRESLATDLGISNENADILFGSKGGEGLKEQQADYAAAVKERNDALDSNIAKLSQLEQKDKSTKRSMGANFRDMAERIEGGSSALAQFAQGIGFLSAGNKDLEQFVKTLATIKGVADIGVGTVKMFTNLAQMISAVKDRQEMANQKQEIAQQKMAATTAAVRAYQQVLQGEANELTAATIRNKDHAESLERVAREANRAATAERNRVHATTTGTTPVPTGGRRGGKAGFLLGLGGVLGGEAIASYGGGGVASSVANYGLDALISRITGSIGRGTAAAGAGAASSAAGSAASTGTAAAAGAAGIGSLAVAGAAAAAALGAVALVGVEVKEAFQGTATKAGSVSDTIGSWEARVADWVGDMTGFFDLIGNSEGGKKADKALEARKKKQAEKEIQDDTSSDQQRMQREAGAKINDRRRADMATVAGVSNEVGKGSLSGLRARQANLQRELAGEAQFGNLFAGGNSDDKRQRAESLDRRRRLQMELSTVGSTISGVQEIGGVAPGQELEARKVSIQKELKKELTDIAKLEKDVTANRINYVSALQRADALNGQLVQVEREHLDLIRSQKDERVRANEEAIDGANKRLEMIKRERQASEQVLKSGAERFASLSAGDQAAAKRAMALANSGGVDRLSDRQRGLLRSIGTSRAVEAAEKADAAEAQKKGFFKSFGQEEQSRIAAAGKAEQQLKVEIANTQAINLQVELDYKRMASEVVKTIKPIIARAQSELKREVDTQLNKDVADRVAKGRQDAEKLRNLKKST